MKLSIYSSPSIFVTCYIRPCPSFFITFFEGVEIIFLATCQSVKVLEKEGFERALVDPYLEKKNNNTFLN